MVRIWVILFHPDSIFQGFIFAVSRCIHQILAQRIHVSTITTEMPSICSSLYLHTASAPRPMHSNPSHAGRHVHPFVKKNDRCSGQQKTIQVCFPLWDLFFGCKYLFLYSCSTRTRIILGWYIIGFMFPKKLSFLFWRIIPRAKWLTTLEVGLVRCLRGFIPLMAELTPRTLTSYYPLWVILSPQWLPQT